MIKVAIIIPMYNMADIVSDAVESALAQTYPNKEITVIDDGSSDNSLAVARSFESRGVRVITQPNSRLVPARNRGIRESDAEAILPLDADDKIAPTYLEETVPLLTEGVGFVSTDMMYFGASNKMIPTKIRTYADECYTWGNTIPVCSLISRKALEEVDYYHDLVVGWEDWLLWLDILQKGWKMAVVNKPLFFYRIRPPEKRSESMAQKTWDHVDELAKKIRTRHPMFIPLKS